MQFPEDLRALREQAKRPVPRHPGARRPVAERLAVGSLQGEPPDPGLPPAAAAVELGQQALAEPPCPLLARHRKFGLHEA